jgi:hypothetical protein
MELLDLEIPAHKTLSGKKERVQLEVDSNINDQQIENLLVKEKVIKGIALSNASDSTIFDTGADIEKDNPPPIDGMKLPHPTTDFGRTRTEKIVQGLPDLFGTLGATLMPPLTALKASQFLNKVTPKNADVAADAAIPIPGLGQLLTKAGGFTARNAIRFSPNVAGATAGGFMGGIAENMAEKRVFSKLASGDLELPSERDFYDAFENAKKSAGEQFKLELAGSAIFGSFNKLLGPNAENLTKQGRRVLEWARKNDLPIIPSKVTGAPGVIETVADLFLGSGRSITKDRLKSISGILEAPRDQVDSFIGRALNLDKKRFLNKDPVTGKLVAGAMSKSEQQALDTIQSILQSSILEDTAKAGINVNTMQGAKQGGSSLVISGDKLLQNLSNARKSGLLKDVPKESIEALENLALYAKVNGGPARSGSIAKEALDPTVGFATAGATGAIAFPLVTGNEGIAGTNATYGEVATTAAVMATITAVAASTLDSRGFMNRWLTNGFVDSQTAREMVRLTSRYGTIEGRDAVNEHIVPKLEGMNAL